MFKPTVSKKPCNVLMRLQRILSLKKKQVKIVNGIHELSLTVIMVINSCYHHRNHVFLKLKPASCAVFFKYNRYKIGTRCLSDVCLNNRQHVTIPVNSFFQPGIYCIAAQRPSHCPPFPAENLILRGTAAFSWGALTIILLYYKQHQGYLVAEPGFTPELEQPPMHPRLGPFQRRPVKHASTCASDSNSNNNACMNKIQCVYFSAHIVESTTGVASQPLQRWPIICCALGRIR